MNNMINLIDDTTSSQLVLWSASLQALLRELFKYALSEGPYQDTIKPIIEKLECHLHHSKLFDEVRGSKLTEINFILYFWGSLMKDLLIDTDKWSHCNSFDDASSEFAKQLKYTEYYSDKQVANMSWRLMIYCSYHMFLIMQYMQNFQKNNIKHLRVLEFGIILRSIDLTQIMRQRDDAKFSIALNNMTRKTIIVDDIVLLQTRTFKILPKRSNCQWKQSRLFVSHE
ncbi:hypothetical protein BD770DRAFT_412181 [Pilaira anomala]|nr:hypothetical protein BD770DRAFT_412181 [Pilaira anomala]